MFCKKLGKFKDLKYSLISGGKSFDEQFEKLVMNQDNNIACWKNFTEVYI